MKYFREKEKNKIVCVEWVDSSRLPEGWFDWKDIEAPNPHVCVSVGFIAAENEKGITVVPTVADIYNENNRHTHGGMMIPRGAIIRKRILK